MTSQLFVTEVPYYHAPPAPSLFSRVLSLTHSLCKITFRRVQPPLGVFESKVTKITKLKEDFLTSSRVKKKENLFHNTIFLFLIIYN